MTKRLVTAAFFATCCNAQVLYSVMTNPTGTPQMQMQVSDITVAAMAASAMPTITNNYAATFPIPLATSFATAPIVPVQSTMTWTRYTNTHLNTGEHLSHWRIGGELELKLQNPQEHLIDFSWNLGSQITVHDNSPNSGALRIEVYRIERRGMPSFAEQQVSPPTIEATLGGQVWTATFNNSSQQITSAMGSERQFESGFLEVPLSIGLPNQQIDLRFFGASQTHQRMAGSVFYGYELSYWPGASTFNRHANDCRLMPAMFQRDPQAPACIEFAGQVNVATALGLGPDPIFFFVIGPESWSPLTMLGGCQTTVEFFDPATVHLLALPTTNGPMRVSLPINAPWDRGTWAMQWLVFDGDVARSFTSTPFVIGS